LGELHYYYINIIEISSVSLPKWNNTEFSTRQIFLWKCLIIGMKNFARTFVCTNKSLNWYWVGSRSNSGFNKIKLNLIFEIRNWRLFVKTLLTHFKTHFFLSLLKNTSFSICHCTWSHEWKMNLVKNLHCTKNYETIKSFYYGFSWVISIFLVVLIKF
jgi:hypothetical protein